MEKIAKVLLFFGFAAALTYCSSTYKNTGECKTYKPIMCLKAGMTIHCETNSDGCETCNCVDFSERGTLIQKKR